MAKLQFEIETDEKHITEFPQLGDVLTSIDGQPVEGGLEIVASCYANDPGKRVRIEFVRDGETHGATLTICP